MTAEQIMAELESLGSESYKRVLCANHGVKEPCFGVKISSLKKLQKRIKTDHPLALALFDTGNYDAMYLAGLIADDARMTKQDLNRWVANAHGGALAGYTVPWVAAGNPKGWAIALEWIHSPKETTACAGWATLGFIAALKPDEELDLARIRELLKRVRSEIKREPDLVRYQMNNFLIAVGCYIAPLTQTATIVAEAIGPVTAYLGNNSCQVPSAVDYIQKCARRGEVGRKRKTVKC